MRVLTTDVVIVGGGAAGSYAALNLHRAGVKTTIVCKGLVGKAPHGIWMRKVKTVAYLEELRRRFGADWEQYGE